jgi:poly-gamma-glutamate synthesis protein (capsule biosynthesis protein)
MTETASPDFDWSAGQIRFSISPESDQTREWSVVICGDWAPLREQAQTIKDPARFYSDLLPILKEADLAVVNLEGVLSDGELQPIIKDGPVIRLPASLVSGLTLVPFHLACLANNHILDYGSEGLGGTMEVLARHGIQFVGAGLNGEAAEAAKIIEFGPTRLAVINVAEGEECRSVNGGPGAASLDLPRLQQQIASLRQEADIILVLPHAGREHLPIPAPHIRQLYRSLAEAGADLIIGHHPHMPQGIEYYKGTLIAYSLGNFAFLMESPLEFHHLGYFFKARFRGPHIQAVEIWPYHIVDEGLRLMTDDQRRRFCLELKDLSAFITDDGRLDDIWSAIADHWLMALGLKELADVLVAMGAKRLLVLSTLRASLSQFEGRGPLNRLARSMIWRVIRRLESGNRLTSWRPPSGAAGAMKKGAAILRNRFNTISHQELYLLALRRVMDGKVGHAPEWAIELLRDWKLY